MLKARRRTISTQSVALVHWHEEAADFQYKVLFGDADKIANGLKPVIID